MVEVEKLGVGGRGRSGGGGCGDGGGGGGGGLGTLSINRTAEPTVVCSYIELLRVEIWFLLHKWSCGLYPPI